MQLILDSLLKSMFFLGNTLTIHQHFFLAFEKNFVPTYDMTQVNSIIVRLNKEFIL